MSTRTGLTDASVFCGYWPFRALPIRDARALKAHLKKRGVGQAWVASSEAILYPDPMQGNEALFEETGRDDFFVNTAVIDPTLPAWKRDTEECLKRWNIRAIKLTPNYHSYSLADGRADELAALAAERNTPVCVQIRMMDERTHHPLMKVPNVDPEQIVALAGRHPRTRFLACGAYQGMLARFATQPNLWAEISFVELGSIRSKDVAVRQNNTLPNAVEIMKSSRVVFASHSPFLYFEAATEKLNILPGELNREVMDAVRHKNARELLGGER